MVGFTISYTVVDIYQGSSYISASTNSNNNSNSNYNSRHSEFPKIFSELEAKKRKVTVPIGGENNKKIIESVSPSPNTSMENSNDKMRE